MRALNMTTSALLLAAGLVAAACGGGSKPAATPGGATTTSAVQAASREGWATPKALPVTPVAGQFTVKDPKLDALPGAHVITGTYDGGGYQIEVPDAWNGDVVYFAHGFRGNGADLTINQPPLREYLVQHGYAWAASSYSQNGYRPGVGARDTLALRDIFAQKAGGEPRHSYLYGQSMGGNVVTVSLETYPTAYDGALSECGSLSGQGIVDYILSWGALGGYFSGFDLTSQTTDIGKLADSLRNKVAPVLGPAANLTPKGQGFASAVEHLTGGPRPYFREGFSANYLFNFLLLLNAVAVPGAANAVAQNADTQYAVSDGLGVSSDQLNREIPRVQANPAYQDHAQYPEFGAPTGKIQRPLLTLHGTGDLFVPITMEQVYRRAVDAAGAGDLLVQRAVRRGGHCTFTEAERERAFEDMVSWAVKGQKPAGEDLLGDLTDAGRAFTSPLGDDDPGGIAP
jgi:pimeloyl-ACP methyl ester carboxylesterase